MPTAISIDLETLKSRYDAAILSIGAAAIDLDTGKLGKTFYREINLATAMKAGSISPDTLAWWVGQNDKAKRVFSDHGKKVPLSVALYDLGLYVAEHKGATVWGNGSSFDITILEYAYDHGAVGQQEPWAYWDVRDMRTIVDVAAVDKKSIPSVGVAHNALDDAIFQAHVIHRCWVKIRSALGLLKVKPAPAAVPQPAPAHDEDDL
jgi:hypothetical protein